MLLVDITQLAPPLGAIGWRSSVLFKRPFICKKDIAEAGRMYAQKEGQTTAHNSSFATQ
jgi:hypothetical protein